MFDSIVQYLPLLTQLGGYLKQGMDHYAALRAAGATPVGPDAVAFYLREKMSGWDPQINKVSLLDDPTRDACAQFLAGVAINLTKV